MGFDGPQKGARVHAQILRIFSGILVQTVVFITIYTGFGMNTDITKGVFDRFRSLPIWRPAALVGALLGDAARYAMASAMVIVLGLVLGFGPGGGVLGVPGPHSMNPAFRTRIAVERPVKSHLVSSVSAREPAPFPGQACR
jgi:hypothetical protein